MEAIAGKLVPSPRRAVAILIVLEQGWKPPRCRVCSSLPVVAILIVLEQGWKVVGLFPGHANAVVAILIVLEQGWKIKIKFTRLKIAGRNPHCTGAGLEVPGADGKPVLYCRVAILIVLEQGWKRSKMSAVKAKQFRRNPHCTGAGLEEALLIPATLKLLRSQSSLYWSRVGRIVRHGRHVDPHNSSQSSLYWSRVGRNAIRLLLKPQAVAILIVLEQGWKTWSNS